MSNYAKNIWTDDDVVEMAKLIVESE